MESSTLTEVPLEITRAPLHHHLDAEKAELQTDTDHGILSKLTPTQKIIVECLAERCPFVSISKSLLDSDLKQILQNGGLDSPGMLIFKANLEARLSLKSSIPITSLLRAQTIRELETEIMKVSIASNRDLLLPFTTKGSQVPLFLFPPGGGELHCWIELVRHFDDRPLYGLRLRGLQPGESAFESMDEMVRCFLEEIRQVQPRGPYALLGMCFGGNIAFEVAKALEAAGEVVAFAGGIDNAPNILQMSFATLRFFIVDLLSTRRLITPSEASLLKKEMRDQDPALFPRLVMRRFRTRLQSAGVTLERLESWHRVFCGTVNMAEGYAPQGKINTYRSFWADPLEEWGVSKKEWETRVREWGAFADSSSFNFIGGNHYTALTKDHVEEFKAVLDCQLQLCGV
ncbi:peptide synthase protein [Colletotrichum truncatum]|uniref:Peptide synthase protein n=1 Tax=Colletotrichum truncatum TaxID=5467 RepID=A0ACC3YE13_COLTU|nr:peptide synthase protein [Colletotrichum truncatum]KAF6790265.1 peptide synthase protein [Colletotrichum truncatum]